MSRSPLNVDDIYQTLLERMSSGAYTLGSRLPSCRSLAEELGSNASTVNRALQRLAADGLVRIEARRGTFVTTTEHQVSHNSVNRIEEDFTRIIARARSAGYGFDTIQQMFDGAVAAAHSGPVVAFVECNPIDLRQLADLVENATGVALKPVLLTEITPDWREAYDVMAAPLFHLADVASAAGSLERVVELNFVPGPAAIRELAVIDPDETVTVAAPTDRGLERMRSLVRQFYPGRVRVVPSAGNNQAELVRGSVLVHTNASVLDDTVLANTKRVIMIRWELDAVSAGSFWNRVEAALGT
ncbi:MAG: GntR family transcriptional regulator [Acidimicrobiia bacterium]